MSFTKSCNAYVPNSPCPSLALSCVAEMCIRDRIQGDMYNRFLSEDMTRHICHKVLHTGGYIVLSLIHIYQVEAMIAKYPGTEKVLLGGSPYMLSLIHIFKKARAIESLCFCPPDSPKPFSPIFVS